MRTLGISVAIGVFGGVFIGTALAATRPAPSLDIVDSSGKHFVLSAYRGKVVVVQFLLTNCGHCQAFSQILGRLQTEYGPKGFQAVGAAVNDATIAMAEEYHGKYAPSFPVGAEPRESAASFMGVSVMTRVGFPQIAVIDRQGRIREQSIGDATSPQPLQDEAHLRGLVEKLLAEGL